MSLRITFSQPAPTTIVPIRSLMNLTLKWTGSHLCFTQMTQRRSRSGKSSELCSTSRRVILTSLLSAAKINPNFDGEIASKQNLSGFAQLLRAANIRSILICSKTYSLKSSHVKRALRWTRPLSETTLAQVAIVCRMWPSFFGKREATSWSNLPHGLTLMPSFGMRSRGHR